MTLDIYTPYQLAMVREDPRQTVTTSHWLTMFFPNTFVSTQEEIAFSKLNASRKIAPFMLPNEPGKPIYRREGERIESFKPAYTKPKDAVRPSEFIALSPGEIVARGYPEADVRRTVAMLRRNEYKRRQAPPGVRVTQRGFGKDWRYPITSRYRDA